MSAEDLERYEAEMELQLYREYRDVVHMFGYIVETERRFYLANEVEVRPHQAEGDVWFELELRDAWVWDMYRPARFVPHVRVLTFRDVNVEELPRQDATPSFLDELGEAAGGPQAGPAGGALGGPAGGPLGGQGGGPEAAPGGGKADGPRGPGPAGLGDGGSFREDGPFRGPSAQGPG